MLQKCIAVGCGGFLGAVLRYLVSLIRWPRQGNFPVSTLLVNVIGAVLIGIIIRYAELRGIREELLLFLKVGLCGGLTTFSTFSAETFRYFETGSIAAGMGYIAVSVGLCVAGVLLGMRIV